MSTKLTLLTYDVELRPGESLTLPKEAADILGPGHWTVSIRQTEPSSPRNHSAFLNSYASEDEGLYDDYQAR